MTQVLKTIDVAIESKSEGSFYFICDLDGENYQFDFAYNRREQYWYFSIFDHEGSPIKESVKCVINWPLLLHTVVENMPTGLILFVDDRTKDRADPSKEELGVTARLCYSMEVEE